MACPKEKKQVAEWYEKVSELAAEGGIFLYSQLPQSTFSEMLGNLLYFLVC